MLKGAYGLGFLVWVKNQGELVDIWQDLLARYKSNIQSSIAVVYTGLEHYRLPFAKKLLGSAAKIESIGVAPTAHTDETDSKLLQFIAYNGRAPLIKIAKHLSLTPAAAQYRLKGLIAKKIILGFRPIISMQKLGYVIYKMDFNLNDMSAYGKMQGYARRHEDILYLDKSIGQADIEIEACVQSQQQFFGIFADIKRKFSASIRDADFIQYSEITKLAYVPKI